jgi:chemotaxis methyl-accepting protein methylase
VAAILHDDVESIAIDVDVDPERFPLMIRAVLDCVATASPVAYRIESATTRSIPRAFASINEFHAIVARNVLPQHNATAQYRLHRLMFESLMRLGFLCLGPGEYLIGSVHEGAYRQVVADQPIYRRMR